MNWEQKRNEIYEQDPAKYNTRLLLAEEFEKVPQDPKRRFNLFAAWCAHAFGNEARIRHAECVTREHVLFTLLQDGTDTSKLLDRLGVDRVEWRRRLDAEIPSFDKGPRFPTSVSLVVAMPSNAAHRVRKPVPAEKGSLTKEQMQDFFEIDYDEAQVFTDLFWLRGLPNERGSFAGRLFFEAGITDEDIEVAIREQTTGDSEWYSRKPAFPDGAYAAKPRVALACKRIREFIWSLAEFEARIRHAPDIAPGHLVLALCVDGTDTFHFLQSAGVNREALVKAVKKSLPVFDSGPLIPKRAMHLVLVEGALLDRPFYDLLYVGGFVAPKSVLETMCPSPVYQVLRDCGVTYEAISAYLASLDGD